MKARIVGLAIVTACQVPGPPAPVAGPEADVAYLASPALAGRETGTPGGDSAAAFIGRRYLTLSLRGAFPASCERALECPAALFQFFNVDGRVGQNIAAVVSGSDPSVRSQYVVIGAHYDHIGQSTVNALDPELGPMSHPGADDNASGTAAVLELGRRFERRPARRSIVLVNFDAEELGMVGSRVFVMHPPVLLQSIVFMLDLDMIGRLRFDRLFVDAKPVSPMTKNVIASAAAGAGLQVQYTSEIASRSDHASFAARGIEAAALFTGFHIDYHKTTDVASRVNLSGLIRVIDVAEAIARAEADR